MSTTGVAGAPSYLPATKELRDLLEGLFGREVALSPTAPLVPGPANPSSVAVYVDDSLLCRAVIVCDLAFSAYAGAAIALLPLPAAEAAVTTVTEGGPLEESLAENLYEVLNVVSALFNAPGAAHVRLLELHPVGSPLPPEARMRALTLGRREDLTLDIAGYGPGRLSIVMVA